MADFNPLIDRTPPAWEIIECIEHQGWWVKIHGRYICDGETGERSVFRPGYELRTMDDFGRWRDQVKRMIARLSGAAVITD